MASTYIFLKICNGWATVYRHLMERNIAWKKTHFIQSSYTLIDFLAAAFWKYLIVSLLNSWKACLFLFETVPRLSRARAVESVIKIWKKETARIPSASANRLFISQLPPTPASTFCCSANECWMDQHLRVAGGSAHSRWLVEKTQSKRGCVVERPAGGPGGSAVFNSGATRDVDPHVTQKKRRLSWAANKWGTVEVGVCLVSSGFSHLVQQTARVTGRTSCLALQDFGGLREFFPCWVDSQPRSIVAKKKKKKSTKILLHFVPKS